MYSIFFTNQARRVFKKLPQDIQDKLKTEAATLGQNPLAGEPLQGGHRHYRSLHVGHKGVAYRIIYQIISKVNSIVIVLADKRENIYKRLEEMKL
jgi:mRNA-degrading endonuclease RelE of RelBE toxin-antitoxin system